MKWGKSYRLFYFDGTYKRSEFQISFLLSRDGGRSKNLGERGTIGNHIHIFHSCFRPLFHNRKIWGVGLMYLQIHTYLLNLLIFSLQSCNMQLTDEPEKRCYPLGDHLYCRSCHIRQGEKLGYTSSESVRCGMSILIIGSNNQIPICES